MSAPKLLRWNWSLVQHDDNFKLRVKPDWERIGSELDHAFAEGRRSSKGERHGNNSGKPQDWKDAFVDGRNWQQWWNLKRRRWKEELIETTVQAVLLELARK